LFRLNVLCRTAITVPAVFIHTLRCWRLITSIRNESAFSFAADLPHTNYMLPLLRTIRSPVTKFFALVPRKFLFCAISTSYRRFTGIHSLLLCCIESVEVTDRLTWIRLARNTFCLGLLSLCKMQMDRRVIQINFIEAQSELCKYFFLICRRS
jgi:hypothetical protein